MHIINGVAPTTPGAEVVPWRHTIGNWNFTQDGGAQTTFPIFTVTGDVYIFGIFGVCKTTLDSVGAPKIELGIVGNTASLIAQTLAKDLDVDETWQDAAPTVNPAPVILLVRSFVLAAGADIGLKTTVADLTAGAIDFHVFWAPLSLDGYIVPV